MTPTLSRASLVLAGCLVAATAQAQSSTAEGIAKYREMLQDGNPAELFEMKGEELWKKPRGPKNASLEKCDLGKGPGVIAGAFVELPRYFKDTGRVQDLETRLITCMETLQGIKAEDIVKTRFGQGEMANVTALATYVATASKGMKFNLPQSHPQEKLMYEAGKRIFFTRAFRTAASHRT